MKSARWISSFLMCAGFSLVAPAHAANDGWYFVGFAGEASADGLDQTAIDNSVIELFNLAGFGVVDATSSLDDSDTGFGLSVGYQVTKNFAAELSYVDLGSVDYRASGTVTDGISDFAASVALSASAQGPVFSLLGILPIGERFSAYGRVGLAFMDTEATARVTIDDVSDRISDSTQRSNGLFGVGGDFSINDRFGVRLEWNRYADVGSDEVTGESDIDLITLAVRYSLR